VLQAYAERAAIRAVREQSREQLVLATKARVVGALDSDDWREALLIMPLIEDASKRLGIELAEVFEDASGVVGQRGAAYLVMWLGRAPEDRTLECMRYEAIEDEDGFRYRRLPLFG
jgi:hypothetical protein